VLHVAIVFLLPWLEEVEIRTDHCQIIEVGDLSAVSDWPSMMHLTETVSSRAIAF